MGKSNPLNLAVAALFVASLACGWLVGGPSLTGLRTAFDEQGARPTVVYSPVDTFYVVGDLKNAPADTVVGAVWKAAAVEGYASEAIIYEQVIDNLGPEEYTGTIYFQLSNESDWLLGVYRVDIFLNGTLIASLPFSVRWEALSTLECFFPRQ